MPRGANNGISPQPAGTNALDLLHTVYVNLCHTAIFRRLTVIHSEKQMSCCSRGQHFMGVAKGGMGSWYCPLT